MRLHYLTLAVLALHGTTRDSRQLLQLSTADFLLVAGQPLYRLGSCADACPGNGEIFALANINDISDPGDVYPAY